MPFSSINQSQHVVPDIPSNYLFYTWKFVPLTPSSSSPHPQGAFRASMTSESPHSRAEESCKIFFSILWDKTHVADLLIVGVKQQLGLKLLSIPAGSSFDFTDFWAKCVCSTPGPRALASARCSHHQIHSREVPSCL